MPILGNMDIYMVDTTADTIKESIMGNMGINMEDTMGATTKENITGNMDTNMVGNMDRNMVGNMDTNMMSSFMVAAVVSTMSMPIFPMIFSFMVACINKIDIVA
jgi:hypothetical protein